MRAYKSRMGEITSVFNNVEDAVAELREILLNGLTGDSNEYTICEMSEDEFKASSAECFDE
jgi:hypothetical protein